MSAAPPVNPTVRRATAAPARPASSAQPARAAQSSPQGFYFTGEDKDEFILDLSDIPKVKETMDVEGFKPSFFSKLLDMIVPRK